MAANWFDRLITSLAEAGRAWIKVPTGVSPLDAAIELSRALLSEKGEASGAALAKLLLERLQSLDETGRRSYYVFLSSHFAPEPDALKAAAEAYLADPTPAAAARLNILSEAPRRELIRRLNMAQNGTAALVSARSDLLDLVREHPELSALESDLAHLFGSWFNRGFLELRRIDWNTSASVLEKLIKYEAVHEIQGWEDLRRRLAEDRRCFAFFHPALDDEPLIFVEVALVRGMAGAIQPLLDFGNMTDARAADTAIFYSISNCQRGLRGISFGNFLIKQVVEELRMELPNLRQFATLSPIPGFRAWVARRIASGDRRLLRAEDRRALIEVARTKGAKRAFRHLLEGGAWQDDIAVAQAIRAPLMRLCALYLTEDVGGRGPVDPVARFHLGNGARLERINWRANMNARGIRESFGLMVNYLYDPPSIEANHEAFVRGRVVRSDQVNELMAEGVAIKKMGSLLNLRRRRVAD